MFKVKENIVSNASLSMLRGSLITLKRRCGTKTCKCASGVMHESPALSCTIGGKSHIITLNEKEVIWVREALERYAQAYSELETICEAGITALRQQVDERKAKRKHNR